MSHEIMRYTIHVDLRGQEKRIFGYLTNMGKLSNRPVFFRGYISNRRAILARINQIYVRFLSRFELNFILYKDRQLVATAHYEDGLSEVFLELNKVQGRLPHAETFGMFEDLHW